jgi:hypothetical protein
MKYPFSIAAAGYTTLTLAVTWPLCVRLPSVVPHDLGDPLLSASVLWWNAHVWPFTDRWWNGFAFFPAMGTIGFSDPRLGLTLIAAPIQWLGFSPITAYNITLLATYPMCALAAHAAAFTLTNRHDAAAVCGLAFGFNPYRLAHISHLELLAAFGMPVALASLHLFLRTRSVKWLSAFAVAFLVQATCSTYYALFFSVLLALWLIWFIRVREWRLWVPIVATCFACAAALSPIALGFIRIHRHHQLQRSLTDLVQFSGDITSLFTASEISWLWHWTATLNPGAERKLFPGLTIIVVAALGAALVLRRTRQTEAGAHPDRLSKSLIAIAALFAVITVVTWRSGPWQFHFGPLSLSAGTLYKPFSIVVLTLAAACATTSAAKLAYRRRSPFAFYLLATVFLFACSFGPKPAFLRTQVFYEPPYAWLMRLPVFDTGVRVPARFAMVATLALAMSAALAFDRLARVHRRRQVIAAIVIAGIVADALPGDLAFPSIPKKWSAPEGVQFGPTMELPLADGFHDFEAMYRATQHGHPLVNGSSGYMPAHYFVLKMALAERDTTVFDPLTAREPLLVVVERHADSTGQWETFATTAPRATVVAQDDDWISVVIAPLPPPATCTGAELAVSSVIADQRQLDIGMLTDRNPFTSWTSLQPQRAGATIHLDLARPRHICGLQLSLGKAVDTYPRGLNVATSLDATNWTSVFDGSTAGLTIRAAVEHPREVWVGVPVSPSTARFLRLRLDRDASVPWSIADVRVVGSPE